MYFCIVLYRIVWVLVAQKERRVCVCVEIQRVSQLDKGRERRCDDDDDDTLSTVLCGGVSGRLYPRQQINCFRVSREEEEEASRYYMLLIHDSISDLFSDISPGDNLTAAATTTLSSASKQVPN